MKETIEIRNFGPIPYINIEIKKLTIFIGSQGTGKSTISKLLTIFRDLFWHWCILNGKHQMRPFAAFRIDSYFKSDTYLRYQKGTTVVTFAEGKFTYRDRDLSDDQNRLKLGGMINNSSDSVLRKLGYNSIEEIPDRDLEFLLANFRTLLYIPAERIMAAQLASSFASLQLANVPIANSILAYMSFFEKAQKSSSRFEIPFLNVFFENKDGRPYVGINNDGNEAIISLDACSSGIQSVLPLIMVIDYCCKEGYFDSYVIEEPEQNLFPVNQKELLRLIFRLWKTHNHEESNLVITTHSPYTLTCVNVELLASIVGQDPSFSDAVAEIIPREEWLDPKKVAVYALNQETSEYATSLINPKTHLIGANAIDTVSEIISSEYNRLYKLYLKQLKA